MAKSSAGSPSPESRYMLLCVLRHGDAGDALALPDRDALRPLTSKGRKQSKRAGKALKHLALRPRDVWSSRLRRAAETAEIAASAAGGSPRLIATAALAPEALPERIAKALLETPPAPAAEGAETPALSAKKPAARGKRAPAAEPPPVVRWIVGHEPHLSRLIGYLTGTPPTAFRLEKGSIAILECDGRGPVAGMARLSALFPPDALKELRDA